MIASGGQRDTVPLETLLGVAGVCGYAESFAGERALGH